MAGGKIGRPSKYDSNVKPHLNEIKNWIREGITDKEISQRLGINQKVLCKYKSEFKELNELYLNTKKEAPLNIKEEKWCVYIHTFPNQKVYVGITSQKPEVRWCNGKGYSKNTYVRSAIDKYGWDNVKHEILFDDLSEAEAKAKEIELIEKYDSNDPSKGYNLTKGGEGVKLTAEQKRQMTLKKRSFGTITFAQNISDVLARLEIVQKLSTEGFTKEEIANMFGVSRTTWYTWEKEDALIQEAIDTGRIEAVKAIKAALYKRAIGFEYTEKKVIRKQILLDGEDESKIPATLVQTEEYTKQALPDPTAALMLLKHWDDETEWCADPASLKLKKQELEFKKEQAESEVW